MTDITIALDRNGPLTLQDQLRQGIVEAIYAGSLRPGDRMPSTRALAHRLRVSRNTVVLTYGDLIADGYLEARDRSGIFVLSQSVDDKIVGPRLPVASGSAIVDRMDSVPPARGARCPPHWRQYPWPFWDGRIDASLLPIQEWRKAVRRACSPRDTARWSAGNGELDNPMLIEQLRTKILPERGINALQEEVMVTHSLRQALLFLVELLVRADTPVLLEEPVDPELLLALHDRKADIASFHPNRLRNLPDGVIVITGARSGVTTGQAFEPGWLDAVIAADGIVMETAIPPDTTEAGAIRPALYANAGPAHVIHVGSLSPAAACNAPPAFVVSDAAVLRRLRRLRRAAGAVPETLQQGAWAYFLSLGYYASALQKARQVLTARKTALRDALNHYLHAEVNIHSVPGASAYWVAGTDPRQASSFPVRAASSGVLVQPARMSESGDGFLMGVTSIAEDSIRDGVREMARVFRQTRAPDNTHKRVQQTLSASAMKRTLAGRSLLYNTVYGEPCTIRICRSGELIGMAGYADDDPDRGRWWIEGDRWFRQWNHWAYGEAEGFRVAVDGEHLYWCNDDGNPVDQAVILPRRRS